jgi:glycerophosphoryl diester phosphodiesterase
MLGRMPWIVSCLFLPSLALAQANFTFFEPVDPPRKVQIMVHRGMHMLAPENTLPAILACADDFIEWAEIDVRKTKEGQHVVIHNGTVDATTDGKGSVAEMTVEDIKKLDAGSRFSSRSAGTRIPMLREALLAAKGRVNLYLDCKEIEPKQLVDDIRSTHMESQVIVYDSPEVIARIREESNREIATMTKYRPHAMPLEEFIGKVDPAAVEVDADDVSAELCSSFHSRGIKVQAKVLGIAWDRPKVWTKMIDAGVDWLQTDEPAVLRMTEVRRRIKNFPIQIAYHRGANRYAPENTLPAIEKAVALDADYI